MKSALLFVESSVSLVYKIDLITLVDLFLNYDMLVHVKFCCNIIMCFIFK